jgi:hypothetical protein
MIFYKEIQTRSIPYDYAVITWEKHPYIKNNVKGLNFLSLIKPWIKPKIIQWSDERIWNNIAKTIFKKFNLKQIRKIYYKLQFENLLIYNNAILNKKTNKIPYNYEAITNTHLKNFTLKYLSMLNTEPTIINNNIQTYNLKNIIHILKKSKSISNKMNKKTDINQSEIKNLLT